MSEFLTTATAGISTFLADVAPKIAVAIGILIAFVGLGAVIRHFRKGAKAS